MFLFAFCDWCNKFSLLFSMFAFYVLFFNNTLIVSWSFLKCCATRWIKWFQYLSVLLFAAWRNFTRPLVLMKSGQLSLLVNTAQFFQFLVRINFLVRGIWKLSKRRKIPFLLIWFFIMPFEPLLRSINADKTKYNGH